MLNINEIGNVHDRIDQLADHFHKGNKAAFGRGADIQSGVLAGLIGGRKNKPSFEVLQKILTGYPSVNPTWLLFGRGPMLNDGGTLLVPDSLTALPSKDALEELVQQVVAAQLARNETSDDIYRRKVLVTVEQLRLEETQKELSSRIAKMEQDAKAANLPAEHIAWAQLDELKREARMNDNSLWLNNYDVGVLKRINTQNLPMASQAVYRITGEPDVNQHFGGLLTHRLSITEEQAKQLVLGRQIRATNIEGVGFRVTEQAVLEFLGEA